MQWRMTVEAVDNTGDEFAKNFRLRKISIILRKGVYAAPSRTAS